MRPDNHPQACERPPGSGFPGVFHFQRGQCLTGSCRTAAGPSDRPGPRIRRRCRCRSSCRPPGVGREERRWWSALPAVCNHYISDRIRSLDPRCCGRRVGDPSQPHGPARLREPAPEQVRHVLSDGGTSRLGSAVSQPPGPRVHRAPGHRQRPQVVDSQLGRTRRCGHRFGDAAPRRPWNRIRDRSAAQPNRAPAAQPDGAPPAVECALSSARRSVPQRLLEPPGCYSRPVFRASRAPERRPR